MSAKHKWVFTSRFRAGAYGWKGSRLAAKRLKEAVAEIRKAARSDAVLGAEGAVLLLCKVWPATEELDDSWGTFRGAIDKAVESLIPIIRDAPADGALRAKWMKLLYEAVLEDEVNYLYEVEEQWPKLCVFPEHIHDWADRIMVVLRDAWNSTEYVYWIPGTIICLSCLLELERYDELEELVTLKNGKLWPINKYLADALVRQGRIDEALEYAQRYVNEDAPDYEILRFCERVLIDQGKEEEAYTRYGLNAVSGNTYLASFNDLARRFPSIEKKRILTDLMEKDGRKGKWFAAARRAGFRDVALDCASDYSAEPSTLVRGAKDELEDDPEFAFEVGFLAVKGFLEGQGYEPEAIDFRTAYEIYLKAAESLDKTNEAQEALAKLHDELGRRGSKWMKSQLRRYLDSLEGKKDKEAEI